MTEELTNELKIYEEIKDRLISEGKAGKYAVVGDGAFVGVWDTYADALQSGYSKFGLAKRFLVKKIEGIEGLQFFTRDIVCRA